MRLEEEWGEVKYKKKKNLNKKSGDWDKKKKWTIIIRYNANKLWQSHFSTDFDLWCFSSGKLATCCCATAADCPWLSLSVSFCLTSYLSYLLLLCFMSYHSHYIFSECLLSFFLYLWIIFNSFCYPCLVSHVHCPRCCISTTFTMKYNTYL